MYFLLLLLIELRFRSRASHIQSSTLSLNYSHFQTVSFDTSYVILSLFIALINEDGFLLKKNIDIVQRKESQGPSHQVSNENH